MLHPLVSIIIPVFNAAEYLERCIFSVLNQTLKEIEIIVVNDGSRDESLSILKNIAAQDSRIIIISNENKGVSAARNSGLAIARSEFIGFVDADDWVEEDMYEKMYSCILRENADLVICNVCVHEKSNNWQRLQLQYEVIDVVNDKNNDFKKLMNFKYDYSNWNKLYRKIIISDNNIIFPDKIRIGEDLFFNCHYWLFLKKSVTIKESLYNYSINSASAMNKVENDLLGEHLLVYKSFLTVTDSAKHNDIRNVFKTEMFRIYYYYLIPNLAEKIINLPTTFLNKIKMFRKELLRAEIEVRYDFTNLSFAQRIKLFLLQYNFHGLFSFIEIYRNLVSNNSNLKNN